MENKKLKSQKIRVLSLFSGAMGLDLGLEQSGFFNIIACIEKDPTCCQTIRLNQRNGRLSEELQVLEGDLSHLSPEDALKQLNLAPEDIDVVVGGPPCQSFSTAGKRGTIQDPRGTLLWDFLRFVDFIRPKFFLMENVRGLLSAALKHRPIAERPDKGGSPLIEEEKAGSVIRLFSKDLANIKNNGYHLDIFEVNSVNYGSPQIRERVLIIGNQYNLEVDFPDPTHGFEDNESYKNSQLNLFGKKQLIPWKTLGDAIADLAEEQPVVLDFSPRKKSYLEMIPPGSNWRSLPKDKQKDSMGKAWFAKGGRSGWWRRLSFDLPCPTLVTMPNHASTSLCHPTETRALSIREYSRIQEFPDDWEFVGTVSEQYKQIGNAVPTRLSLIAGKVISSALDKIETDQKSNREIIKPHRIVYLQSHVRTRSWFKDGEPIIWNDGKKNRKATYAAPKTVKKIKGLG